MVKEIKKFVANDGTEFDTFSAATRHEIENARAGEQEYLRYMNTWACKKLLEQHKLDETGIWQILGEDPNCDLGGAHHNPMLGYLEGKLENVIREAVKMDRFWQWGSGGQINKVTGVRAV